MTNKVGLESVSPIRVQSVADHVVEQLERLIEAGTFAAGEQLPAEQDLADALQVGRSTVREAKQALVARGLLISRGRAGTFVASHDADEMSHVIRALRDPSHREISEVREVIEVATARMASSRVTPHEIATMRSTLEDLEKSTLDGNTPAFERSLEIHRLIAGASHNGVLASLYDLLAQVLLRTQVPFLPYIADWNEEIASHRRLVDAVASGDPEVAAAGMTEHLRHSDKYRHDLLESGSIKRLRRGRSDSSST